MFCQYLFAGFSQVQFCFGIGHLDIYEGIRHKRFFRWIVFVLQLFTLLRQLDLSTVCSSMIEHKINFPYLTPYSAKFKSLLFSYT